MSRFQVGDKVLVNPAFNWQSSLNQNRADLKTEGTIKSIDEIEGRPTLYEIRFDSGALDRYYESKLDRYYESKLIPVPEPKVRDEWAETIAFLNGKHKALNEQYEKADTESREARKRAEEIHERRRQVIIQIGLLEDNK